MHGVSQLVMLQMTGDWGIHSPALSCLNPQARQSTGVITGGVRFLWVPREQNWVANQRASGIASGALALLVCVSTAPAGVPAPLRKHPAGPNAAAHASFKGCMRPRVGAPTAHAPPCACPIWPPEPDRSVARAARSHFPAISLGRLKARGRSALDAELGCSLTGDPHKI